MPPPDRPGAAMNTRNLDAFGAQAVERMQAGFTSSRNPMLVADDERRWITGNAAAAALLGMTPDVIPWRTLDDVTPPNGREPLHTLWSAFLDSGAAEGWYELYVPERGAIPVEFSAIANVLPRRHLLVFLAPDDASVKEGRRSDARGEAWAPVAVPVSASSTLTRREREVITLIAAGGQSGDIARALFLSSETVRSHVSHALAKLGARTRAHAVAISLVTGEIDWPMGTQDDAPLC